jgi:site-specific DNA-adenine methylase
MISSSFAYVGSKHRLRGHIINMLPLTGDRYVEPFAGRGSVYFHVAQLLHYRSFWLNDTLTIPFFEGLRDAHLYMDDIDWCDAKLYDRMKAINPVQPAPLLEPYLCFNGGTYYYNCRRGRVGGGVSKAGYIRKVWLAHAIMQRTKPRLTRWDYREVLSRLRPSDVVYFDAPYLGKTDEVGFYSDKTVDYQALVEHLLDAPYRWVYSAYPDEIYRPLTTKFGRPQEVVARKLGAAGGREWVTECLWNNIRKA